MSRREMREQVFKLLFRVEFNDENAMQQQKELFFEDGTVAVIASYDEVLGLDLLKVEEKEEKGVDAELEAFVLAKIEERAAAKKEKNS